MQAEIADLNCNIDVIGNSATAPASRSNARCTSPMNPIMLDDPLRFRPHHQGISLNTPEFGRRSNFSAHRSLGFDYQIDGIDASRRPVSGGQYGAACGALVRYTPDSRRSSVQVACPLSARSGHSSSVVWRGNSTKKRLTIRTTAKLPQRFRIS